jgi:hypothetical protein
MDCDVYMEQPEGFTEGYPRQTVCLLQKSIYGTKQGGNRWNKKMCTVLEPLGFTQSYSDASIYVYVKGDTQVILLVFCGIPYLNPFSVKLHSRWDSQGTQYPI